MLDLTKCCPSHVKGPTIVCPSLEGLDAIKGIEGLKFKAWEDSQSRTTPISVLCQDSDK